MGKNILIVDDEFDLVETCVRLLVRQGFTCLRAYTGQQGITLIGQQHPDVVLTDLHLPDVDGLNVLRHAREHSPSIPGILMTDSPSISNNGHAVGGVQYLPKPFSNAALLEVVNRALR